MKYDIQISEDGTYVRIRVYETITGEMEIEFAGKAIKEARKLKINKFLVDVRGTTNVANTFEQYGFGYVEMALLGLEKTSRIAIIADEGDTSHNFIETVLRNAGYDCLIFSDKQTALNWFEKSKPPSSEA